MNKQNKRDIKITACRVFSVEYRWHTRTSHCVQLIETVFIKSILLNIRHGALHETVREKYAPFCPRRVSVDCSPSGGLVVSVGNGPPPPPPPPPPGMDGVVCCNNHQTTPETPPHHTTHTYILVVTTTISRNSIAMLEQQHQQQHVNLL